MLGLAWETLLWPALEIECQFAVLVAIAGVVGLRLTFGGDYASYRVAAMVLI